MRIRVRSPSGKEFSVHVDAECTVRDMKQACTEKSEIEADLQKLIFKGKIMKDDKPLSIYGM